jgi:hypothetical protein
MTTKHRWRWYIVAALIGAIPGCLAAYFRAHDVSPTDCLIFAGIFGCCLGAIWQRPGSGTIGSLAAFGFWAYLVPYLAQLVHS